MISCTEFKLRRKKLSTSDLTYPPCCQLRHSGAVLTSNLDRVCGKKYGRSIRIENLRFHR
ncbi:MAG: hypothetical protein EWV85_02140 [Microcystis aeruginosa Ma_QC_C_20070703_M131]|uniref:Uncharacterized protein n=1 Tax=Microcystis aeruginosa Ma_QC_C_20070703_M131 TaxID=2486263 RepID=A0A551YLH8_MICAE|nr:MAG: hypothetical protein EWV85_02140 [Microcystis aeruginosa Ma_QC_C_20070703_M131]